MELDNQAFIVSEDYNCCDKIEWLTNLPQNDLRFVFESYPNDSCVNDNVMTIFDKRLSEDELLYTLYDSTFFVRTEKKIRLIMNKCKVEKIEQLFFLLPSEEEKITLENIKYVIDIFPLNEFTDNEIKSVQRFYKQWDNESLNYLWEKYPNFEDVSN
jgi:hypothetical protein